MKNTARKQAATQKTLKKTHMGLLKGLNRCNHPNKTSVSTRN